MTYIQHVSKFPEIQMEPFDVFAETYQVLEDYKLTLTVPWQREVLTFIVPKGFIFDAASIPRILWPVLGNPYDPKLVYCSLIHDYLYRKGLPPELASLSRKQCDHIFAQILEEDGYVSKTKINTLWFGIRIGGWISFRKKQVMDQ